MEDFTKKVQIPSNGLFGVKEVTIRNLKSREEKILYMMKDYRYLRDIVKSCITEPTDINVDKLHPNDILTLLFHLRDLTFGPKYFQEYICPTCGTKQNVEIHIDEMEIGYLDIDELTSKLTVKLPVSGDEVILRYLNQEEIDKIEREAKKRAKYNNADVDEIEYGMKLCKLIESVKDKEFKTDSEKEAWLEGLSMADVNAIHRTFDSIPFGIDTTIITPCANCGEDMEVRGLIAPEFFRPKY